MWELSSSIWKAVMWERDKHALQGLRPQSEHRRLMTVNSLSSYTSFPNTRRKLADIWELFPVGWLTWVANGASYGLEARVSGWHREDRRWATRKPHCYEFDACSVPSTPPRNYSRCQHILTLSVIHGLGMMSSVPWLQTAPYSSCKENYSSAVILFSGWENVEMKEYYRNLSKFKS